VLPRGGDARKLGRRGSPRLGKSVADGEGGGRGPGDLVWRDGERGRVASVRAYLGTYSLGGGQVSVGERKMVLGGIDFPVGKDVCGGGYIVCSSEVHRSLLPRRRELSAAHARKERTSAVSVQV
jgi:hypothetical protein